LTLLLVKLRNFFCHPSALATQGACTATVWNIRAKCPYALDGFARTFSRELPPRLLPEACSPNAVFMPFIAIARLHGERRFCRDPVQAVVGKFLTTLKFLYFVNTCCGINHECERKL
jgi:hypothetical protein